MGMAYDESVDVYSFGLLLLDMAVEEPLLEFIGERWRVDFGKKQAPKQVPHPFGPIIVPQELNTPLNTEKKKQYNLANAEEQQQHFLPPAFHWKTSIP